MSLKSKKWKSITTTLSYKNADSKMYDEVKTSLMIRPRPFSLKIE